MESKDIGFRKAEFVAKTQFLYLDILRIFFYLKNVKAVLARFDLKHAKLTYIFFSKKHGSSSIIFSSFVLLSKNQIWYLKQEVI